MSMMSALIPLALAIGPQAAATPVTVAVSPTPAPVAPVVSPPPAPPPPDPPFRSQDRDLGGRIPVPEHREQARGTTSGGRPDGLAGGVRVPR